MSEVKLNVTVHGTERVQWLARQLSIQLKQIQNIIDELNQVELTFETTAEMPEPVAPPEDFKGSA